MGIVMTYLIIMVVVPFFAFCQEDPSKTFSAYHYFADMYILDLREIANVDFESIIKKNNRLSNEAKESELKMINLAKKDKKNIDAILTHQLEALKLIDNKAQSLRDVYYLIDSAEGAEKEELIRKFVKSCQVICKKCPKTSSLVPFYWHTFLLSMLESPVIEATEVFKKDIFKNHILPFMIEMAASQNMESIVFNEYIATIKFKIYLIESDFKNCRNEIENLTNYKKLRYNKGDSTAMVLSNYLETIVLYKEKKYRRAIEVFKTIPEIWQDPVNGLTNSNKQRLTTMVADAYLQIEDYESSKTWREVSLSMALFLPGKSGKAYALKEALALRNIYQKEKSWTLMRNLEERSARFGMKPLPKQFGED